MRTLNFGSLNRDMVYTVDHIVSPGETAASSAMQVFCGGKGLDQSLAMARAGASVAHAGAVGEDGGALVDLLAESGADTRLIRRLPGPCGHAVIQVDRHGQNSILLFGGANRALTDAAVRETLDDYCGQDGRGIRLIVQNETSSVAAMLREGHARGMHTVFNPSPFSDEILHYPLDAVDCFVINEIEGAALTGQSDPQGILQTMQARYPHADVLLTLGGEGAMYATGGTLYRQPIFRVPVRDTTAAGDTFLGYFFALLDESDVKTALRYAAAASALAVSVAGAAASIPYRAQVHTFLAAQQP